MEHHTLNHQPTGKIYCLTSQRNQVMKSQILKSLFILCLLVSMTNISIFAQKVMEFSDAKLVSGSILVPAGINSSTIPPRDTTLVVPAGKVWKIVSVHTGFSQSPFTTVSSTNFLSVSVNNCQIHAGWASPPFEDFWLPSGSYSLKYSIGGGSTPPVPYNYKFSMSILEYATTP